MRAGCSLFQRTLPPIQCLSDSFFETQARMPADFIFQSVDVCPNAIGNRRRFADTKLNEYASSRLTSDLKKDFAQTDGISRSNVYRSGCAGAEQSDECRRHIADMEEIQDLRAI